MTWQDELRRLDEELAAGRLSAEEYRQLRDALLAHQGKGGQPDEAAGHEPAQAPGQGQEQPHGQPAGPAQGPSTPSGGQPEQRLDQPTQVVGEQRLDQPTQVVPAGQQQSPFPPPFKWDSSGPPDATQVMRAAQDPSADTTQVVSSQQTGQPPAEDAERTQVVPGAATQQGPHQQPPPGQPHQQHPHQQHPHGQQGPGHPGPPQGQPGQPGGYQQPPMPPGQAAPWGQGTPDTAPPWASMDLPPTTDVAPGWYRQGPEVFEPDSDNSKLLRIVGIVAVVVILAAISVGAYFLFKPESKDDNGGGPTGQTSSPPATSSTPTPEPGPPVAEMAGTAADYSHITEFAHVEEIGYLTVEEVDVYKEAGADESKFKLFDVGGDQSVIVLIVAVDQATAADTRDALADLQEEAYNMAPVDSVDGVRSSGKTDNPLFRAHYVTVHESVTYLVRVQAKGPDADATERLYDDSLGGQLDVLQPLP